MQKPNPDTTDLLVCVGGVADRQQHPLARSALHLHVPHRRQLRVQEWPPTDMSAAVEVSHTVYERSTWHAGDAVRFILTPVGQSPEQTLDLLIEGYANGK